MPYRDGLCILLIPICLFSCSKEIDVDICLNDLNKEALIFGTFNFGSCDGGFCAEIYRIQGDKIYRNISGIHPTVNVKCRTYDEIFADANEIAEEIDSKMTIGLLDVKNSSIGCPDCYDQGGVYLETIDTNGVRTYWILDQIENNISSEFHDLMEVINETVKELR